MTQGQELRRGAYILLACGAGSATSAAALVSFTLGAFMLPLQHAFGWSRAEVGGLALGQSIGLLLVSVPIGAVVDRYGARRTSLISQPLLALGFFIMALLPGRLWFFYLGYVLLFVLGAGTLTMVWTRVLVDWFHRARGLAMGLALMFNGLLGSLTPLYVTWLIGHGGWRAGYLGLGLLPVLVGLPISAVFLRDRPEEADGASLIQPPGGSTARAAFASRRYWQLCAAFLIGTIGTYGVMTHALPLLVDRGVAPDWAASVAGLFGLAVSAGRVLTGVLLDRFHPERVAAVMFVVPAFAALLLFAAGGNLWLSALAILLTGLSTGAEGDSGGYLVARHFGRKAYGTLYGLLFALSLLGGGIGPALVGKSQDLTHSYDLALMVGIGVFLTAALLLVTLPSPDPACEFADRSIT